MNVKILIVEDETIIAKDLAARLKTADFSILGIADSGEQALEMCRNLKPDLVLMDIMISGSIDGIETTLLLNKEMDIPVIFLTAYADEETISRAKKANPSGYILKPFKDRELFTVIDIALFKHRSQTEQNRLLRWQTGILQAVQDGLIAVDPQGKITLMNRAAEKVCAIDHKDALGRSWKEILPFPENEQNEIEEILDGNPSESDFYFKDVVLRSSENDYLTADGAVSRIMNDRGEMEGYVISIKDTTSLSKLHKELHYTSNNDMLTGLANRENFTQELERILSESRENNNQHALLYLDIDRFKIINDTCGHTQGDELLREAASILTRETRGGDYCARLGGNEFGIILKGADEPLANSIAERLREQLTRHQLQWKDQIFHVTPSIGIVSINSSTPSVQEALASADDACYKAKDRGGNRIEVYKNSSQYYSKRRGEMWWIPRLTTALKENRFKVFHQPISPLSADASPKTEILIRMIDTNGKLVMPADFIPAAERYNLMGEIDRWIIGETLKIWKTLEAGGNLTNYTDNLSINLSGETVMREDTPDYLLNILERFNVDPKKICFEITETAAISNIGNALNLMERLAAKGCTFALDDFGSGFSSFSYLRELPVHFLKIDGIFVQGLATNPVNTAMVRAITNMAKVMGKKTIAEFVDSESTRQLLIDIGVDYAQGYYIGHPSPFSTG